MNLNHIRLQSHRLTGSQFTTPEEAVAWMGAVQAQSDKVAEWAVGLRTKDCNEVAVKAALDSGSILRTHVLRPTWHFVTPENIRWMLRLTGERIKAALRSFDARFPMSEADHHRGYDLLGKLLGGGRSMTRQELADEFVKRGFSLDTPRRMAHLLMLAEADALVCSGVMKGRSQTYALLDERAPDSLSLSDDEALARLAMLYFRSHAPATLADFSWWSGLPLTVARTAVASLGSDVTAETWQEQTYYIHSDAPAGSRTMASAQLLPAYDEFLIAYRDRSQVLQPRHYARAFSNNGIFQPVVLWRGRVVGNWKCIAKKGSSAYEYTWFEGEKTPSERQLRQAEKRYSYFMGG